MILFHSFILFSFYWVLYLPFIASKVKLISSDASNNIPFQLIASSLQLGNVMLTYNKAVTVRDDMNNTTFVKIPKSLKGKIQIANYRLVMENEIMPFVRTTYIHIYILGI